MVLKVGSEGADVKKLQEKLGVEAIGKFGPKTEAAVKAWQKANGLKDDGIVGPATWAKLFGESTPAATVIKEDVVIPKGGPLNIEKLKGHIPDAVLAQIPETAAKFKIDTPLKLTHFLAQCGHESGGWTVFEENLNYSAQGLNKTFKKYFPTLESAQPYAKKPEMIANKIYANRMGNGGPESGDGWKYRGRGPIQLTGHDNYLAFAKDMFEDWQNLFENPDWVTADKDFALMSAIWFWNKNKLNVQADSGDIKLMTKKINGGYIGLEDRIKHYNEAIHLLT